MEGGEECCICQEPLAQGVVHTLKCGGEGNAHRGHAVCLWSWAYRRADSFDGARCPICRTQFAIREVEETLRQRDVGDLAPPDSPYAREYLDHRRAHRPSRPANEHLPLPDFPDTGPPRMVQAVPGEPPNAPRRGIRPAGAAERYTPYPAMREAWARTETQYLPMGKAERWVCRMEGESFSDFESYMRHLSLRHMFTPVVLQEGVRCTACHRQIASAEQYAEMRPLVVLRRLTAHYRRRHPEVTEVRVLGLKREEILGEE